MRLLHIIHSVDPRGGGPIEALTVRARLLAERGHAVEVASCDDPAAAFVSEAPLPVHACGPGRGKYGFAPRLAGWLRRRSSEFDAVIVNGIWQYHAVAARHALHGSGQPYFLFPHGMLDPWFQQHYPLKHLKKLPYWLAFERRNLRDAAAVLYTSEEEQLRARRSFPGYRAVERIAPYGVLAPTTSRHANLDAFGAAFPALAGRRFLLFMGRIHEKKGCDLLLDAFAAVAAREPELDLLIAGPDDGSYAAGLKQRAEHLGIAHRTTWAGMLRGDLKNGALAAAEAFVLPSHQENFGVAVAEALAWGTPVLISDKVNIWREIDAAAAGLVERDDDIGTAKLLDRWLATSTADREAMRRAAAGLFASRYDIAASLDEFLSLIRNFPPGAA